MSGIILIVILAAWFFLVKKLTGLCVMKMQEGVKKTTVTVVIFILLFVAPVADEIIGGFQFRAMCTPENLLIYNAGRVRGEMLKYKETDNYHISNKILPINVTHSQWVDPMSGEVLIDHKIIYAKAGLLLQLIGWTDSLNGHCDTKEYYELFEKLNVTKIEN